MMKEKIHSITKPLKKLLISSLVLLTAPQVNAENIQFEINGVNSEKGMLYVQLFKGQQNFDANKAELSNMLKPKPGKNTIIFNNIEPGEYAIRYFHDADSSGKLEFNLFGMPVEGYGFSNDAWPDFGPPEYQQVKFLVTDSSEAVINHSNVIYQ